MKISFASIRLLLSDSFILVAHLHVYPNYLFCKRGKWVLQFRVLCHHRISNFLIIKNASQLIFRRQLLNRNVKMPHWKISQWPCQAMPCHGHTNELATDWQWMQVNGAAAAGATLQLLTWCVMTPLFEHVWHLKSSFLTRTVIFLFCNQLNVISGLSTIFCFHAEFS